MKQNYYDYLPKNYFKNVYLKVVDKLIRKENVCVSAIYGVGGKTFLNLFLTLVNKDGFFKKIILYDPEVETKGVLEQISATLKSTSQNYLVIIRQLEKIENRKELLEKLSSLQQVHHKTINFLAMTDHTAITNPENFFGKTTSFFSEKFYLSPFNLDETSTMITINNEFFGWKINLDSLERIHSLSGGIPRLIKHICKDVSEFNADLDNLKSFYKNPSITFELNYLINLLITLDRDVLQTLGLIDQNLQIKSGLVKKYLQDYTSKPVRELLPELSHQETKILSYLYENINHVLTLDKLQDLVEMGGLKTTPWAIYKLISRLKPKTKTQFEIKNIKGRGYLLQKNYL